MLKDLMKFHTRVKKIPEATSFPFTPISLQLDGTPEIGWSGDHPHASLDQTIIPKSQKHRIEIFNPGS